MAVGGGKSGRWTTRRVTSNGRGREEEEDAVTMSAVMFLCGGGSGQPCKASRQWTMLNTKGDG